MNLTRGVSSTSKVSTKTGHCNYFDLAVIGAGPAGSLTAALAAKAGLSTVILEKTSLPRFKPCGGFISSRALSLLPSELDFRKIPVEPVYRINLFKELKIYNYISSIPLGLLVKREQFDHMLADHACKNGAILLGESSLESIKIVKGSKNIRPVYHLYTGGKNSDIFKARYVVGADGAAGRVASLSGLRSKGSLLPGRALVSLENRDNGDVAPGTLNFFPLPLLGGMGWSFHSSLWINRGVGGLAGPRLLENKYNRLFSEGDKQVIPVCWPLPYNGPLRQAGKENLLLVGDACGLVEPFSGEGLYNSFKSAILASSALIRSEMEGSPAGEIYNNLFKKHFKLYFACSLAGAVLLHGCSVVKPVTLPRLLARLMENRLWFNRPFKT